MKKRAGILKALTVVCVLVSLAQPRLPSFGPPPPPILVVDVSASVGHGPFGPKAGVDIDLPWYAVADGVRALETRTGAAGLSRDATRLGRGLAEVVAHHPGRGIWLITDGRATDTGAAAAARRLRATGGRLDVAPVDPPPADVSLVLARARRRGAGGAEIDVRLRSSTTGKGTVVLSREGRVVVEEPVEVRADSRQDLVLVDPAAPAQPVAYRVRFLPAPGTPDDEAANNELAVGLLSEQPAILVWGDLPAGVWSGPDVPFGLRLMKVWEPGALDAADLVILSNLPWSQIGDARVEALVHFVAGGGRVLLLGGPRSWRAGGWAGTALEQKLAPLRTPIGEGDDLAVMFLLDHSGSTAEGALDALAGAVGQALDDIGPGERMAVLPFAARPASTPLVPGWIRAGEGERRLRLERALGRLAPGGGTDIVLALEAGGRLVARAGARQRRLLLLTDGDPDRRPDPVALARVGRVLEDAGVRFGAVVSGSPALAAQFRDTVASRPEDVVLLESVGRVPDALLKQLALARHEEERRPRPSKLVWLAGGVDPLEGVRLAGVHVLEAQAGGRILARATWAEDGMSAPLVAQREIGAGIVVGMAWGPKLEDGAGAAAVLDHLTPWVRHLAESADRGLHADLENGEVVVQIPGSAGTGRLSLLAQGETSVLYEEAPGRFRGRMPCRCRRGVRVVLPPKGGASGSTRALDLPALQEAELRGAGIDTMALDRLARAGGGRRLGPGETPSRGPSPLGPPLAPLLLLIALGLLVAERVQAGRMDVRSKGREASS